MIILRSILLKLKVYRSAKLLGETPGVFFVVKNNVSPGPNGSGLLSQGSERMERLIR